MTEAPSTVPFHRRRRRLFLLLLTVAGALVLLGMAAILAHASTDRAPAAVTTVTITTTAGVTTTATVTATRPAAAPQTKTVTATVTVPATGGDGVTDGTYEVGTDIQPGTYKTRGEAQEGGECYWARMSSSTAVIAEHKGGGPQLVTVKASDKYFRTEGCQPWRGESRP